VGKHHFESIVQTGEAPSPPKAHFFLRGTLKVKKEKRGKARPHQDLFPEGGIWEKEKGLIRVKGTPRAWQLFAYSEAAPGISFIIL